MYVRVLTGRRTAVLEEPDDLARLHVEVVGSTDPDEVAEALGALGTFDGEHAWLRVPALRSKAAGRVGEDWDERMDALVGWARGKGWVREDGPALRAHLQRVEGTNSVGGDSAAGEDG